MSDNLAEKIRTAELSKLMTSEYSRENQRRIHRLLNLSLNAHFMDRPSEDIFEDVATFNHTVFQKLFVCSTSFPQRHAYAFKMLKKMSVMSYTVALVVGDSDGKPMYYLDHSSIGTLCRTIIETAIMHWYLSEEVSAEEWEFRLAVMKLHDASSRVRLFKGLIPEEATKQRKDRDQYKDTLNKNAIFQKRTKEDRDRLLGGQVLYVDGMRSLFREMNCNEEYYDGVYNYLSAQAHSHPISYFREKEEGDPLTYYFQSVFVGYALHHASAMIARASLKEVEVSDLGAEVDAKLLDEIRRICSTRLGSADRRDDKQE